MRYLNLISHIALLLALGLLSACASTASRSFKTAENLSRRGNMKRQCIVMQSLLKAIRRSTNPGFAF